MRINGRPGPSDGGPVPAACGKNLAQNLPECREYFLQRQEKVRSGDPLGNLTRAMNEDHRVFAIAHYVLDHDIDAFRASLSESGRCQIELWQRKNNGEDIFYHFVNVGCFRYLFDTLAGGDFKLATELARLMEAQSATILLTTSDSA